MAEEATFCCLSVYSTYVWGPFLLCIYCMVRWEGTIVQYLSEVSVQAGVDVLSPRWGLSPSRLSPSELGGPFWRAGGTKEYPPAWSDVLRAG